MDKPIKPNELKAEFISASEWDKKTDSEEETPYVEATATHDWEQTLATLAKQPGTTVRVPRTVKRKDVTNAFLQAFELIGGVPALAIWAAENPQSYYPLLAKLLPRQQEVDSKVSGGVTIRHVLPATGLDRLDED